MVTLRCIVLVRETRLKMLTTMEFHADEILSKAKIIKREKIGVASDWPRKEGLTKKGLGKTVLDDGTIL